MGTMRLKIPPQYDDETLADMSETPAIIQGQQDSLRHIVQSGLTLATARNDLLIEAANKSNGALKKEADLLFTAIDAFTTQIVDTYNTAKIAQEAMAESASRLARLRPIVASDINR